MGKTSAAVGEDVDCNGHIQDSFADLRFTGSDGITLLDYWIESIVDSSGTKLATIWIENDAVPSMTCYMYYGNPTATAASNGTNTFIKFENFEDSIHYFDNWVAEGTAPNSWDNTKAVQGSACLKLVTTAGGTAEAAHIMFAPITQVRVFFWLMSDNSSLNIACAVRKSVVDASGPYWTFTNPGALSYMDIGYHQIGTYNILTWYRMEMKVNTDTDTYNLDQNNVNKGSNLPYFLNWLATDQSEFRIADDALVEEHSFWCDCVCIAKYSATADQILGGWGSEATAPTPTYGEANPIANLIPLAAIIVGISTLFSVIQLGVIKDTESAFLAIVFISICTFILFIILRGILNTPTPPQV